MSKPLDRLATTSPLDRSTGSADRRPVIGITSYGRDEKRRFRVSVDYVDAVRRAGGIPIVLPPGEACQDQLFALLDALILSGGGDVAPDRYAGASHPSVYNVDPIRDASEIDLVERIIACQRPCLAICRGAQLLNVALGGSLHPHIPEVYGWGLPHRVEAEGDDTTHVMHRVRIDPDSELARIVGQHEPEVASWHHQAVRDLAPDLRATAWASDGVLEAYELPSHAWLLGLQWHPEITAGRDDAQQRLFQALVQAANRPRA
ncbi:MAG: gamma-glutamyl-gamma-aminobutyrate hydrolase family protein [Chloroflexi bacterium]|nr:gamma-glutamyl-gamma-aminobutyrate hydrolase family protein [Chloroflexota bacterium]